MGLLLRFRTRLWLRLANGAERRLRRSLTRLMDHDL
jgi:hypothetical protein